MKAMTKKERYTWALKVLETLEMDESVKESIKVGFKNDLETLAHRSIGERKPSKETLANQKLRMVLVDYLKTKDEPVSIPTITKEIAEFDGFSSSKVSSLIIPLRRSDKNPTGVIKRTYIRKQAYFSYIWE